MSKFEKKKALFFVQEGVGGAERITILIAKMLDLKQYTVKIVVVPYGFVKNSIVDFIPDTFKVERLPLVAPIWKMFYILRTLFREKPDFCFSSVYNLNNKILPFRSFFKRTKFIIRSDNYLYTFKSSQRKFAVWLYRKADVVIAQTIEMKDELVAAAECFSKKVVVLENPIDEECICKKLNENVSPFAFEKTKNIVASGRFCYQKGFDLLIDAFSLVCKKNSNVALYILGAKDGEYASEYAKVCRLSEKYGISDRVHCVGYQSNPYVYMRYADCFVLSSRWEGLPNVLIESLYLGTPVAATKCVSVIERIVSHGKTGFLCNPDNPESLADAILNAIKLGRIESKYGGAPREKFTSLFK